MSDNWRFEIEHTRFGWRLSQRDLDSDSSFPDTYKPVKEEIVARLMQILDIQGPLFPQTKPERIEIGCPDS